MMLSVSGDACRGSQTEFCKFLASVNPPKLLLSDPLSFNLCDIREGSVSSSQIRNEICTWGVLIITD